MAFDLQEQEQLDQLRTFWERGGKWFTILVLTLLMGFLAYTTYNYFQKKNSEAAGELFFQFNSAIGKKDMKQANALTTNLETKYPKTPFATRAALVMASMEFNTGDLKAAKAKLLWVSANSKEPNVQTLAHLRFAAILFDEKKYADALTELNQPHDMNFDAQFLDLKGDILQAKGDKAAARASYKAAIQQMQQANLNNARKLISFKLSALGA